MASDVQDTVRDIVGTVVDQAVKSLPLDGKRNSGGPLRAVAKTAAKTAAKGAAKGGGRALRNGLGSSRRSSGGPLSGARGVAVGAGAAAVAPVAAKGIGKLARSVSPDGGMDGLTDAIKSPEKLVEGVASNMGDKLNPGAMLKDAMGDKLNPGTMLKDAVKKALPFGGGDDKDGQSSKGTVPGVGKGRRMPVQQAIDIAVPIESVYNQWTQFELWPNFMHRVTRVTKDEDTKVSFEAKIWGKKKEFTAEIVTQRPDERIKWRVTNGITHTGVVTFHELAPRLTRVELNLDVEPGGMLEKAARGMRHIKRAARADLHRFKAFIEMQEMETGAWRGVIEGGEVVKKHQRSYDRGREYSKFEDMFKDPSEQPGKQEENSSQSSGSSSSGRSRSSSSGSGRSRSSSSSSGRSRSSSSSRGRSTQSRSRNHSTRQGSRGR